MGRKRRPHRDLAHHKEVGRPGDARGTAAEACGARGPGVGAEAREGPQVGSVRSESPSRNGSPRAGSRRHGTTLAKEHEVAEVLNKTSDRHHLLPLLPSWSRRVGERPGAAATPRDPKERPRDHRSHGTLPPSCSCKKTSCMLQAGVRRNSCFLQPEHLN